MKRHIFNKVTIGFLGIAGAIGLIAGLAEPSSAQAVQANTIFGCSIPGGNRREDPFGSGTQPANALIATPTVPTAVPTQANLAYFSSLGTFTGQARCLDVAARLNTLNSPANATTLAGYTFGLGTTAGGTPVICFHQIGGTCAILANPLAGPAPLPDVGPLSGYLVMTLNTGDTAPAEALNRLTTNLRTFAITAPATPNIDESFVD